MLFQGFISGSTQAEKQLAFLLYGVPFVDGTAAPPAWGFGRIVKFTDTAMARPGVTDASMGRPGFDGASMATPRFTDEGMDS